MKGIKWTREETLIAFALYCKIPFGKIGKNNPEIIEVANILGRTGSAVAMKMCNIASYDPIQQERGIKGLKNGSKIEQEVWKEFNENSNKVILEAEKLLFKLQNKEIKSESELNLTYNSFDEIKYKEAILVGERERVINERIGQNFFRRAVLSSYNNCCCMTGISISELLIASHIKPWKVSNNENEKTNPRNGLCLNALHDKAFDQGLITIDKNYKVIVSSKLKGKKVDDITKLWITQSEGKEIILPNRFLPDKCFIEYHNDVIFKP